MIKYIIGKEKEAIITFSREIVDAIAEGNYNLVFIKVDETRNWDISLLSEVIESFKEDNDIEKIDKYDVECTFKPNYPNGSKYKQEDIFLFNDNSGFGYEYNLTTNGEPNDLVLNMEFLFEGEYLKVVFESGITV
jgi:hypothetical protein